MPEPAVHGEHDIPGGCGERFVDGCVVVGIEVQMRDCRRRLGALVRAPVHDRDVVASLDEALHERNPGRSGPADDEHARHSTSFPPMNKRETRAPHLP